MSRFVAAGSNDEPSAQDEAWAAAREKIDSVRQKKPEQGQVSSLYETLQANKAAKESQHEEALRLQNQFRSLDEDEVEFLDSVLESTRTREAEVKKQTKEQLEIFRAHQEEAEKLARQEEEDGSVIPVTAETWSVGPKKRKKAREGDALGGIKLRRTSTAKSEEENPTKKGASAAGAGAVSRTDTQIMAKTGAAAGGNSSKVKVDVPLPVAATIPSSAPITALGLVAYSSDEDD